MLLTGMCLAPAHLFDHGQRQGLAALQHGLSRAPHGRRVRRRARQAHCAAPAGQRRKRLHALACPLTELNKAFTSYLMLCLFSMLEQSSRAPGQVHTLQRC